jgi:hypothetical protein
MNKKLLALLFAVPGFCAAQTTYKVLGFAPNLDQVAVDSTNVEGHDFSIALARDLGWYASAKADKVGISRANETKFRLVKTTKTNVFKLFCVNNRKFVAFTDANEGAAKTKFVDTDTDPKTDWQVVPNMGEGGRRNKFDILPGSVDVNNPNSQSWNVYGGVANGNGLIGHYRANDNGSAWCFEIATQELKFFSSYSETNDSYFMTIRGNYVHKEGEAFKADQNLEFDDKNYLFQLVGTPQNFKIYNAATGNPIGTDPSKADDKNNYSTTQTSTFSVQSYGGRVYVKETRKPNLYLNFRDGFLSTWNHEFAWTHRDEGSQILFASEDGILADAAKALAAQIKANYGADKFGEGLGQYPAMAKPGLDVCLQGLEQAQDLTNTNIQAKKDLYWTAEGFIAQLSLNRPKNGDLLYIAATRDNTVKYFTSTLHADEDKGYENYGSLGGHLTTKAQKGSEAVFYCKEEGGKVTLVSVAAGGQVAWAQRDALNYPTVLQSAEKGAEFKVTSRDGKYVLESGNRFLASDANLNYVMAYDKYSAFAGLRLERVAETLPVHIGDGGSASFWSPVEYTVPEGVTAYSVKIVNNKARLTKITTNVPKNTAVFLFGTPSSDVNLTVVRNGQTPALQDNILMGGAMPTTLEGTAFMLKKNGTGLVKVDGAVPAFKAYFTATQAQVRELLDRGLTGVVSVATEVEDAPVYDLSGRRVQQTIKGAVYVTNGKKFIAK